MEMNKFSLTFATLLTLLSASPSTQATEKASSKPNEQFEFIDFNKVDFVAGFSATVSGVGVGINYKENNTIGSLGVGCVGYFEVYDDEGYICGATVSLGYQVSSNSTFFLSYGLTDHKKLQLGKREKLENYYDFSATYQYTPNFAPNWSFGGSLINRNDETIPTISLTYKF